MPLYKATLLREVAYKPTVGIPEVTGWSSNYWVQGPTYSDAMQHAQALNTAELALIAKPVQSLAIRVSDVTLSRDIQISPPTTPNGGYTATTPLAYDPNLGVRVVLLTAKAARANHYIRGMDASLFGTSYPATFIPDATTDPLFAAYQTAVIQHAVHVKKVDPKDPTTWTFTAYDQVLSPSVQGGPQDISIRRSGRPFGQRRGRRRVG